MFILKKGCKTAETVDQMYNYMLKAGLKFRLYGKNDSLPYAILAGESSLGYRIRSKWNRTGIVFFCAADGIDKNNLVEELHLEVFDNSNDYERPYAVFVPDDKFERAVEILQKNSKNC